MTKANNDMAVLAENFLAVYKSGDEAALRDLFTPDFVWWSSAHPENGEAGIEQMVQAAQWEAKNVAYEMTDIRIQGGDDGFVRQCVLLGKGPEGSEFTIPNCMVATVANGKIKRLEEYLILPQPKAD